MFRALRFLAFLCFLVPFSLRCLKNSTFDLGKIFSKAVTL